MGRILVVTIVGMLLFTKANAQSTWYKEWFKQKKTQKEYLINQIAALQVYIGYAKQGYRIYKEGLDVIGRIKDGDFNLHNEFFNSLKRINPEIARYARVADIIRLQAALVDGYRRTVSIARNGGGFSAEELDYVVVVYSRVLEDASLLLVELTAVTVPGKLEMEDSERLQRIDQLHTEMLTLHDFGQRFGEETAGFSISRQRAVGERAFLGRLYGLE